MNYLDFNILIIIFLSVFIGGIIKGTVGIGLSLFSVPIITFFLPPTTSMILLCVPVLITNIIQMKIYQGISSFRFLPMFIALIIGILIGCNLVLKIKLSIISQIIAISVIFAAIVNLIGTNLKFVQSNLERILTVFLGFFSGIIGGISNMYSPYILAYLISSDLEKKSLIRTIATLYFLGSILIFPIWIYNGFSNINELICSCLLLIPAILGQKIGERVQDKISNETFKKIILYTLLIIGISLFIKNL